MKIKKEKIVAVRFTEEEVRRINEFCDGKNRSKVLRKLIIQEISSGNKPE